MRRIVVLNSKTQISSMSLLIATLITSFLLIGAGAVIWLKPDLYARGMQWFLRSKGSSYVFFGGAVIWFLWVVLHLGEADFGQYKYLLFALFLGLGAGAFYFVPDFLGVRGFAILGLLFANLLLDAACMEIPVTRLFLVCFAYALIVFSLYMGAVPYRMRDFNDWMHTKSMRLRSVAAACVVYGVTLLIATVTF
jgi:hypothetical protein